MIATGRGWLEKRPHVWLAQLVVRGVPYGAAVFVLGIIASHHWFWATAACAALVGLLGILVHRTLGDLDATGIGPGWKIAFLAALVELGVVVLAIGNWRPFATVGFLGVSLIGFGVSQLVAEVRDSGVLNGPLALVLVVNFVGTLGLVLTTGVGGWALLLVPTAVAFPAVSIATEMLLDRLQRNRAWALGRQSRACVTIAFVALLGGALLLLSVGGLAFAVVVALVVLLVIGLVSSNTDFDVLFLLVAVAVTWSQFPRTEKGVPPASGRGELLSIGDSYISGEGAQRYYEGTNVIGRSGVDQCRRSPATYSVKIATIDGSALDFLACSGARIRNLIGRQPADPTKQYKGQYLAENPKDKRLPSPTGQPARPLTQLELFDLRSKNDQVTMVMVSIGGNDVGFGDIIQACLAPGDCSLRGQKWLDRLGTMGVELDQLYGELHERFGDRVVVVPYPIPIRSTGCGILRSTFVDREHAFLHAFTQQLDLVIRTHAAMQGLHYLSAMETAFESAHAEICDTSADRTAVNYFALNPVGGEIDPTGWLHNSMHPNAEGHRLMTDLLAAWMKDGGLSLPVEQPASIPAAQLSLSSLIGPAKGACGHEAEPSASCKQSDQDWMFQQTRLALLHRLLAIALMVGGAWLFWLDRMRDRHLDRYARRMLRSTGLAAGSAAGPAAGSMS